MKKLKIKIFNYLMRSMFNAITEKDVLRIKGKKIVIGDRVLADAEVRGLKGEAADMETIPLWNYLKKDMKHIANKKMYRESQTVDDMIAGKMILFTIEVMERKIDNIKRMKV